MISFSHRIYYDFIEQEKQLVREEIIENIQKLKTNLIENINNNQAQEEIAKIEGYIYGILEFIKNQNGQ